MRKLVFCTVLVVILGVVGFGQKQHQPSVALDSGTRIDGQLQSAVDVKKSRVGDEVVLKTTKALKRNGQTVVPKGSKLLGRITEVAQRTKQNGVSRLGMVFDRLEGGNLSAPISASIVSVTNAGANARIADTADADVFGSSRTSAGASRGGSTTGGNGGLLGGVTSTAGGVLNTTTSTVGGVTNTASSTVGSTTETLGRTVNGIQISNSAAVNGSAQTGSTLSAADRNIRLEKGATIQLQLNSSVRAN